METTTTTECNNFLGIGCGKKTTSVPETTTDGSSTSTTTGEVSTTTDKVSTTTDKVSTMSQCNNLLGIGCDSTPSATTRDESTSTRLRSTTTTDDSTATITGTTTSAEPTVTTSSSSSSSVKKCGLLDFDCHASTTDATTTGFSTAIVTSSGVSDKSTTTDRSTNTATTTTTDDTTTIATTDAQPTTTTQPTTTAEPTHDTTTTTTTSTTTTTTTTPRSSSSYKYQSYTWLNPSFTLSINTANSSSRTVKASSSASASATPSNNLPAAIIPNDNVIIPADFSSVTIKFDYLSFSEMVSNSILTAQFVQSVPVLFSKVLGCGLDDIIVQSIVPSNNNNNKKKRDTSTSSGVIVTMALPSNQVSNLQQLISNPTSSLYASDNGQLPTLIDKSYAVNGGAGNAAGVMSDPNASSNNSNNNNNGNGSNPSNGNNGGSSGLSRAGIIGICVSVGVVVYAAATVVAVRVYRQRKLRKEQNAVMDHQDFTQSISAPIMNENTLGFSPYHALQPHQYFHYGHSNSPPPLQQAPHTSTHQW
ncbi:uncharacterized protein BX664DRAFT_319585 [Halteromyces radiatus]|uniref:uncharacterized protein n=1 Tax=Halteromyces radiatus TaxID=101107 RepID=UPI002220DE38|nr:uncharacterized protein BX664DRAFT_319585 [Halteromyces radiatus]KAI8098781.1 hypothetical protein BX664DRAFT_319585 [Halteromyces radiatus]